MAKTTNKGTKRGQIRTIRDKGQDTVKHAINNDKCSNNEQQCDNNNLFIL